MESPDPLKDRNVTYWLTRDFDADGRLNDLVDVWLERPHMVSTGNWVDAGESHWAKWTIQECVQACRVYPETGRECIVVGCEVNEVKGDR